MATVTCVHMIHPLEVNGAQPRIEGRLCEELLVEEGSYSGKVTDPAGVIHLCFEGSWHRLYFDCGIVFWRESDEAPQPYDMPELDGRVRIIDLGVLYALRGERLERVTARAIENGSEVVFRFSGEKAIRFSNVNDVTTTHST